MSTLEENLHTLRTLYRALYGVPPHLHWEERGDPDRNPLFLVQVLERTLPEAEGSGCAIPHFHTGQGASYAAAVADLVRIIEAKRAEAYQRLERRMARLDPRSPRTPGVT